MEELQTMRQSAKKMPESHKLDTNVVGELTFDSKAQPVIAENEPVLPTEPMGTDMVMLERADQWMAQFKNRLNLAIVGMVVLWVGVSYYKSTNLQTTTLDVETPQIVADDSEESSAEIMVNSVQESTDMIASQPELAETEKVADEKLSMPSLPAQNQVEKPAAKVVEQKAIKVKKPIGKGQSKNQKKFKKTLASKPGQ
jgi:hypothetical protein